MESVGSPYEEPTAGNRSSQQQEKYNKRWIQYKNTDPVPKHVPSITDIKKILPSHCFQPDIKTSLYYVIKDLFLVSVLYGSIRVVELVPYSSIVLWMYTPVYWFLQGTLFWSLFVLGHDCGHGSFSNSNIVNDIVGTCLHTLIFVPFYPWKLSHKHHHKNTGNIDRDEIFYPIRSKYDDGSKFAPLFSLGGGWWVYLVNGFNPRRVNHFNPTDPLFVRHTFGCSCSVASLALWSVLLYKYYVTYGFLALITHYIIPVFVFATWLVVVTFLHHSDVEVPWYGDEHWDNVRGQLSSVDRDYGWAHHLTHHIGTHQIHHLFIKIPHYYLEDAAAQFRKHFPDLIRRNHEPIIQTFFKMFYLFESQRHIGDDTKVHWIKGEKKD